LQNFISTADVLSAVRNEQNATLFEKFKVFTRKEFDSFVTADLENYLTTLQLESEALIALSNRYLIPAAVEYQNDLLKNADSIPNEIKSKIKVLIENSYTATNNLKDTVAQMLNTEDINASAQVGATALKTKMTELRKFLDSLEECVGQKYWPIPTYEEILLTRHKNNSHHE